MIRKITISVISVLALLFVFDRALTIPLWYIHDHSNYVEDVRLRTLANTVDADVIFMGASRTCHHYVPQILEDSLKQSVYNAGFDGSGDIFYLYAALNLMLRHHIPKVICLEMGPILLRSKSDNLPRLAPYIGLSEEVDRVFEDFGILSGYKLSNSYRFNSCIIKNIFGLCLSAPDSTLKGYVPLQRSHRTLSEELGTIESFEEDSLAVKYLKRYVKLCKSHDVELIFCMSPIYKRPVDNLYDLVNELALEYDIPFLNYHSDLSFQDDPTLWKDAMHLDENGANLFSKRFSSDLKKILTYKTNKNENGVFRCKMER